MERQHIKLISILTCLVVILFTGILAFSDFEIIKLYNCTNPGKNNYIISQESITVGSVPTTP